MTTPEPRTSLRAAALCSIVVDAADAGDYDQIALLATSGVWQAGDRESAVAALLRATALHDVHCRRAMTATVFGRGGTRGRSLLRSAEFAEAYERAVDDGTAGLDEALRLSRMGAAPGMLAKAVLRRAPEWGADLLRALPAGALRRSLGHDAIRDMATASPHPDRLWPALLELGIRPRRQEGCERQEGRGSFTHIYGVNYNVLRIMSGLGGLSYAPG
jgi:hypothetical protein